MLIVIAENVNLLISNSYRCKKDLNPNIFFRIFSKRYKYYKLGIFRTKFFLLSHCTHIWAFVMSKLHQTDNLACRFIKSWILWCNRTFNLFTFQQLKAAQYLLLMSSVFYTQSCVILVLIVISSKTKLEFPYFEYRKLQQILWIRVRENTLSIIIYNIEKNFSQFRQI